MEDCFLGLQNCNFGYYEHLKVSLPTTNYSYKVIALTSMLEGLQNIFTPIFISDYIRAIAGSQVLLLINVIF